MKPTMLLSALLCLLLAAGYAALADDCASGMGLAIFEMTEAVVNGDSWPPPVVWQLNMAE